MSKILSTLVIAFALAAPSAFAAKYERTTKVANADLRALVKLMAPLFKNEKTFGDASSVSAFDVTRSAGQSDINVAKQLNHMKAGLNSDDSSGDVENNSATKIADFLFGDTNRDDEAEAKAYEKAKRAFAEALRDVKSNRGLKLFSTAHGDEDGSWQVLDILDTENEQIVIIQMGYTGT